MKITPNEYNEMTKKASPGTKSYKTIPMAFLIGGLICMAGEGLLNLYQHMGDEQGRRRRRDLDHIDLCGRLIDRIGSLQHDRQVCGRGNTGADHRVFQRRGFPSIRI